MTDQNIQTLFDIHAIKDLKAKYCRYIDTKLWHLLPTLFAEDTTFEGYASAPSGSGPKEFIAGVSSRLKDAITVHQCHTPEISFLDNRRARGVWAMMDYLEWPDEIVMPGDPKTRGMYGFGHYEEEYVKIEDSWKMSFLRLCRARLIPLPSDQPPPINNNYLSTNEHWLKPAN